MAVASLSAAIVLPGNGNSVTFEADDYTSHSGTSIVSDGTYASSGFYIDGLDESAAGRGSGDFIQFDFTSFDAALTYELSVFYRKGGGSRPAAELEMYSVTTGSAYTLESSATLARLGSGGWSVAFVKTDFDDSFTFAAGTTAIRFESLANSGNGLAHLDSFTISAIPEPGTYALLGWIDWPRLRDGASPPSLNPEPVEGIIFYIGVI